MSVNRARAHPVVPICALALLLLLACSALQARTLAVDVDRTAAGFWVRPLWLKRIDGFFPIVEGTVRVDPVTDAWYAELEIDARALQMHRAGILGWAQGTEFFDVEQYPAILFSSRAIEAERRLEGGPVEGELSLRGQRRPVVLELLPADCPQPGTQCPIQVRGQISRSAFGMSARRLTLADAVHLWLAVQLREMPAADPAP